MKTVQKSDEVRRVSDEEGKELVTKGWKFVPKSVWKTKVRPPVKKVEKAEKVEKADTGKSKYKNKQKNREEIG